MKRIVRFKIKSLWENRSGKLNAEVEVEPGPGDSSRIIMAVGDSLSVEIADREEEPRRRTLGGLRVGESGYTVPWALCFTKDGPRLHSEYDLDMEPGGTVTMKVTRCKQSGIIVNISNCDHAWDVRPYEWDDNFIPVKYIQAGIG